MLGGKCQVYVGRADPLELVVNHAEGEIGVVAFAAQVPKVQMAKVSGHDSRRSLRSGFVGEVTMPTQDPLFEAPRAAQAFLQQLHVVVGFQHQHVGGTNAFQNQFGDVAQVGDETDVSSIGVQEKSYRVLSVMRNGKRIHSDISNFKARSGGEQPAIEVEPQRSLDLFLGRPIAVNGNVQLLSDPRQSHDMVRVLVGDQDGGQVFRRATDAGESLPDLPRAETGIYENARFIRFHISAVARRTAAQNRQLHSHKATLGRVCAGGNQETLAPSEAELARSSAVKQ